MSRKNVFSCAASCMNLRTFFEQIPWIHAIDADRALCPIL